MKKLLYIYFVFSISDAFSIPVEMTGDFGLTQTQTKNFDHSIYTRPFTNLNFDHATDNINSKGSIRAFSDISSNYHQDRFELREVYSQYAGENWNHKIGAQLISFSETFGVQILDVANPRDYTDFILNDLEWSKLPVWAINSKYTKNAYSLQFIYSPYAGKDILPVKNSYYDTSKDLNLDYSSVSKRSLHEYGIRTGYLFENGFDLNFLYYHHQNRTPSFEIKNLKLESNYQEVDSFGASFSYVLSDFVFRGDTLYTLDDLVSDKFIIKQENQLQFIYGVDYTFKSDLTLGYQFQHKEFQNLFWNSVFIQYQLNQNLKVDCFSFFGMNNEDQWIRPKLSLQYNNYLFLIQSDLITGKSGGDGLFGSYKSKDRYYTSLIYQF